MSATAQRTLKLFADDGYDVIVTVGSSISNETLAAAKKISESLFIGVEQPQTTKISNLTGWLFHEEHSGFLSGALAALMTQTQRVGAVCEAKFIDPIAQILRWLFRQARSISIPK